MFGKNTLSAFTLIEIMTVSAILGIMVVSVAPAISSANRNAKAARCSSNLRVIQSAKAAYLMENLGKLEIERGSPQDVESFVQYLPQRNLPSGCPSAPNPEAMPYQHVYNLYKDVECVNNCPMGGDVNDFPLEPRIGAPDYYRNGYHDLYRRDK